jgi:hypothetical protein
VPLIDERGRLFGKINVIDAVAILFALVLIPIAYGAMLLFRVPTPTITSVEPAQMAEHQPGVIAVAGADFRPFLRASFSGTASPGFLVQSPSRAEIKVPDMPAGTYDLILYDESQELTRKPGALTVVVPSVRKGIATVHVRFVVSPQVLEQVKVGDTDLGSVTPAGSAALIAIGSARQTLNARIAIDASAARIYEVEQSVTGFEATLQVPVELTRSGWQYNAKPVKAGAPFNFETMAYSMGGWILSVTVR